MLKRNEKSNVFTCSREIFDDYNVIVYIMYTVIDMSDSISSRGLIIYILLLLPNI